LGVQVLNYLKTLRKCASAAFNANQITMHQHKWLDDAVKNEQRAFSELPVFIRKLINRYL